MKQCTRQIKNYNLNTTNCLICIKRCLPNVKETLKSEIKN